MTVGTKKRDIMASGKTSRRFYYPTNEDTTVFTAGLYCVVKTPRCITGGEGRGGEGRGAPTVSCITPIPSAAFHHHLFVPKLTQSRAFIVRLEFRIRLLSLSGVEHGCSPVGSGEHNMPELCSRCLHCIRTRRVGRRSAETCHSR